MPSTMPRRRFLATTGASIVAGPHVFSSPHASAVPQSHRRRPNIVLVLADDLGYGEVGAYGQQIIRTPHLDRLAAEGVQLTSFYAGGPVCAPSRCSMLTGLHTGHCSVRQNPFDGSQDPLDRDDVTFAEALRGTGYRTGLFGKWGFGPEAPSHDSYPTAKGFEEFFGYVTHLHAHDYYPDYLWDNETRVPIPENADGARGAYAPNLFVERAERFIAAQKDEPFLCVLSTNNPHAPQEVPDLGRYAAYPWPEGDQAHAAQISLLDEHLGRLVSALQRHGLAEDTLVVFASDNGPHDEGQPPYNPDLFDSNGPLRGYKRNVYEGGIRVPLIVWGPGLVGAARSVDDAVAGWDLFPTLADVAGAPAPADLDGVSFLPTLRGERLPDRSLYWFRNDPYTTPRANAADRGRWDVLAEAARRGDWKAVRFAPSRQRPADSAAWTLELFDLATDLAEEHDIADHHPDVAAAMTQTLDGAWVPPPYSHDAWSPNGLSISRPRQVGTDDEFTVTVMFANHHHRAVRDLQVDLDVPAGWQRRRTRALGQSVLPPSTSTSVEYAVVAGGGSSGNTEQVTARAEYIWAGERQQIALSAAIDLFPTPPNDDAYLSDLDWVSSENGWGPVERDRSNGRSAAGDGPPISIRGQVFEKGLGVHAPSRVRYYFAGQARRITATVGIDDFSAQQSGAGSVEFAVEADGRRVFTTGVLDRTNAPLPIDVPVDGAEFVDLVVTDAGDSNAFDHSSWAAARVLV